MKRFDFTVAEHEDFGELGLRPKWYPLGDPLGGMAAAHDILEHFPNDDGSVEGELMALGASVHVRVDGGASTGGPYSRHFDELRDVSSDFLMQWDYLHSRENRSKLRRPPRVRDAEVLTRMRAIADEGFRLIRSERGETDEEGENRLQFSDEERAAWAGWLAVGYVRARRRYSRVVGGICSVAYLFMRIQELCDRALKHAQEGYQVRVYVNVKRAAVRVEVGLEDPYEPNQSYWEVYE
jgi:hypothetical protein